jgi:hypothetical protein
MVTSFSDEAAELAITFAAGDAAGKGDFGDVRMFGQILPGFGADARQDVKYAVRQAGFAVDFRQLQGGERGDFTRLKNHRVTGGQRRR